MLSVNRRLSPLCIEMIFYILSRHASHKKLSDDKCQANDCLTSSFQIYWVRDGVEVQPERDPNFLQASDGHLIIVQVRNNASLRRFFLLYLVCNQWFVVESLAIWFPSNKSCDHFLQTREKDRGNYTCVAENVANTRMSPAARLQVVGKWFLPVVKRLGQCW